MKKAFIFTIIVAVAIVIGVIWDQKAPLPAAIDDAVVGGSSKEVIDGRTIIQEEAKKRADFETTKIIQIPFSITEGDLKYNDALNIPEDQYQKLSSDDIRKMQQQRFENWKKARISQ